MMDEDLRLYVVGWVEQEVNEMARLERLRAFCLGLLGECPSESRLDGKYNGQMLTMCHKLHQS